MESRFRVLFLIVAVISLPGCAATKNLFGFGNKEAHQAKIAFEKYFLRKMRKGDHENFWERAVLKTMGLTRLEK